MKRLSPTGTLAAITLALTLAILLATAPGSQAITMCSGYYYTPQNWGAGNTCDEAYWDLYNRTSADVNCGEDVGGPRYCQELCMGPRVRRPFS
ncbi:MAG TPA: hypothetical protein VGG03_24695 [Thermoanaerobaculia bacterium]|jgi:hypothetical protein